MYSIKPLPEFTAWLDDLTDGSVRGVIAARIKRLAMGLMGDVDRLEKVYQNYVFT